MKSAIGAIALTALAVSSAAAADLAYKAAPSVVAPVYDWSGFYLGANFGWQNSDIGLSRPASIFGSAGSLAYDPHHNGFIGGGQAGLQRQWGQFVLGVEGGYTGVTGSETFATPAISIFVPGGVGTANAKLDQLWNVGGRLGWAPSNWLIYATGGYASGSFKFGATSSGFIQTGSSWLDGYYIGGGVEWAPMNNNWVFGLEYRHYDFGSKTTLSTIAGTTFVEPVRFDPTTDTVTARISYKFGWPGFLGK